MSVTDDLHVAPGLVLPAAELEWTFSTAGGPGGQHANRSQTRAELRFDLAASPSVPDELKSRMMRRLGARASDGVLMVAVDESRSQWRNRQLARRRLVDLLREAMRPERRRKPTKPSRAARRRRLEEKRRRGRLKELRKPPEPPE